MRRNATGRRISGCLFALAAVVGACGSESEPVTATAPAELTADVATVEPGPRPTPLVPLSPPMGPLVDPNDADMLAFFDGYFADRPELTEVGRLDLGHAIVLFRYGPFGDTEPGEVSWDDEGLFEPLVYGDEDAFESSGGRFCRDYLLGDFRGGSGAGVFYISWNRGQQFLVGEQSLPLQHGARPEWSLGVHVDRDTRVDTGDVVVIDESGQSVPCDQSR